MAAELSVMPSAIVKNSPGGQVIEYALAPTLKVSDSIVIGSDREISVMFEVLKVAVSKPPFGTQSPAAQDQFSGVLQSPLVGSNFHKPLPACAVCEAETERPSRPAKRRVSGFRVESSTARAARK